MTAKERYRILHRQERIEARYERLKAAEMLRPGEHAWLYAQHAIAESQMQEADEGVEVGDK